MRAENIKKILDLHFIKSWIVNDRIMAVEAYGDGTTAIIDMSGWTRKQVLDWLGY